mgnify:CR=1 FL=1
MFAVRHQGTQHTEPTRTTLYFRSFSHGLAYTRVVRVSRLEIVGPAAAAVEAFVSQRALEGAVIGGAS